MSVAISNISMNLSNSVDAERRRRAEMYGVNVVQRLLDESRVITVLHSLASMPIFTPTQALSDDLGRLAVGVLVAEDKMAVIAKGIAMLQDYAVAIEIEAAEDRRRREEAAEKDEAGRRQEQIDAATAALKAELEGEQGQG